MSAGLQAEKFSSRSVPALIVRPKKVPILTDGNLSVSKMPFLPAEASFSALFKGRKTYGFKTKDTPPGFLS